MRGASRNPRAAQFLSAVLLTLRRIAFSLRQLSKAFYPPFLHWNPPLERRSWNGFRICRGFSAHSDAALKSEASCPRSAMKKTGKRSPSFATRSTTRRKIPAPRLFSALARSGNREGIAPHSKLRSANCPDAQAWPLPEKRGEAQPPFATLSTTRRKIPALRLFYALSRSGNREGGQYPIRNCAPRPAPMRRYAAAGKTRRSAALLLRHAPQRAVKFLRCCLFSALAQ